MLVQSRASHFISAVNMEGCNFCNICNRKVLKHSYHLKCSICKNLVHLRCLASVTKEDSIYINREAENWFCTRCSMSLFPFNHFFDDELFYAEIMEMRIIENPLPFDMLLDNSRLFSPFELNDDVHSNPMSNIDPDFQFYNDHCHVNLTSCDYMMEDTFNNKISDLQISDDHFSLIHSNIRSIPKNLTKFENYLSNIDMKWSVMAFSESWIKDHSEKHYGIDGYATEHLFRKNRSGGGVSLYIKDSIEYHVREDLNILESHIEAIFIEINGESINKSKNVICCALYRPPDTDVKLFNKAITNILEKIKTERKICYLAGDFNINVMNIDKHSDTNEFIEIMFAYSMIPNISKPTRVTRLTSSLIDNIFTNDLFDSDRILNGILYTDVSDHFPVFHIDYSLKSDPKPTHVHKRYYNQQNLDKFTSQLEAEDWNEVYSCIDPQLAYSIFHAKISKIYDECFPLKRVKIGYRNRKPWLTEALKKSIKHKNKLFKRKNKSGYPEHEVDYKRYRNCLNKLLHNAERDHYEALLNQNKNNMKNTWKILKDVINSKKKSVSCSRFKVNDTIVTDSKVIANDFNQFYVNVGPNLASKIPKHETSPTENIRNRNMYSMLVEPVVEEEVLKIIHQLKISSAGWDSIDSCVVKKTCLSFIFPLTHVMNLSLMRGIVPIELKIARVLPLFKSGDTMLFSNYRPVSVLPLFSKILERLMYTRLLSFVNKHNILYKFQFGFRKGHSPNLALIYLIDRITSALEKGDYVLGIFLDFSKAFDTVDHQILFKKLEYYGVRGCALDWFKSYLKNREQFVVYNGVSSNKSKISCGVPQGSILGPLLFLIYVNDLADVSEELFSLLFADDSNIFLSGTNIDSLIESMNKEMLKVVKWLQINKLSLNLKKTHFMIFRKGRKKISFNKKLLIDNTMIEIKSQTKFLGVIIDDKLSFAPHIKYIRGKVARATGVLFKCRKFFKSDVLRSLYNAFIYPYFTYCVTVWGNACLEYLKPLIILQKRAVRCIISANGRAHTAPIFSDLKILRFEKVFAYCVQLFMYKFHHKTLPAIFNEFFKFNREFHDHDRSSNLIHVPNIKYCKSAIRQKAVRFIGVNTYNYFFKKISLEVEVSTYKKITKTHLLDINLPDVSKICQSSTISI